MFAITFITQSKSSINFWDEFDAFFIKSLTSFIIVSTFSYVVSNMFDTAFMLIDLSKSSFLIFVFFSFVFDAIFSKKIKKLFK